MSSKGFTLSEIAQLALDAVLSWKALDLEPTDLTVEPLTGGCTNLLWKVSIPEVHHADTYPPSVVFRKYCDSNIVDRETEAMVVDMVAKEGITVQVHVDSDLYRIEDFIVGQHPAEDEIFTDELLTVVSMLHNMKNEQRPPIAFPRLNHLRNICEEVMTYPALLQQEALKGFHDFQTITDEIRWLESKFGDLEFEVGLCHNDLHALNILQVEEKPGYYNDNPTNTILIDFEYSDYNYLACEWANSFYELCMNNAFESWPHFDKEEKWPSKATQKDLLVRYFTKKNGEEPSEDLLRSFMSQIDICLLIQHLIWAMWSIPSYYENTKTHAIDWGYAEYAAFRLGEYYSLKNKLIADPSCELNA